MQERSAIAKSLWRETFANQCNSATNTDELADAANQFATQILIQSGAKWKQGSRKRGSKPTFQQSDVDFSTQCRDAPNKALNLLNKTLRRIDDLSFKICQEQPSLKCRDIMHVCWQRIVRVVSVFHADCLPQIPNQDDLNRIWDLVVEQRDFVAKQIRKDRVLAWKKRMQGSAAGNLKDVFHYLKMKHKTPCINAMCDQNNKPIFHPVDAIQFACQQWNEVFDVHSQGVPSSPLINAIGQNLERHSCDFEFKAVTPRKLFEAVAQRKRSESAGVDGWRTCEFQALPLEAYFPWAMLWNFVENYDWDVPSVCKIARLVILPKPSAKSSQPIHQRLIALLCIPYLAYSKARFTECIPWQLAVFPKNVCGGISGRKSSDITHTLAMESEHSIAFGQAIIGIKLDRSKCFDRVVVDIIVQLGKVLGLDSKFLRAWSKLYQGFERFVCWNSCIADRPLKNSNGIAQGDTASVLAINILMSAWAMMVSAFQNVRSAVFVDDAYLVANADHVADLCQALQATKAFDLLAGQALNLSKSSVWATSTKARKLLPQHFPELVVEDFVGVLGGFVKANAHPRIIDASSPFHTIKALIDDIAALPIDFRARVKLISSKVIPKITFNAEVKPWARKCVESFTSAITNALWKDRPIWRSAEILFALATNPIACHPPSAIAATIICNIVARCRQDPNFMKLWMDLQGS